MAARVVVPDLGWVVTNKRRGPNSSEALWSLPPVDDVMQLVWVESNAHLQPFPFGAEVIPSH